MIDRNSVKQSETINARIEALEQRVAELEKILEQIHRATAFDNRSAADCPIAQPAPADLEKKEDLHRKTSILESVEAKAEERAQSSTAKRFFLEA